MGYSLLRLKKSGRDWSRGTPPPRGSIEYCGVADMFDSSPRATLSGKIWEISATELDAANRWTETLARSVDYARQVHGDRVLSGQDVRDFTDFYKRWKKFSSRVTTWSLIERAREENKAVFEELLTESKLLRDRFSKKGMATMPVPHVTELVLMLRHLPPRLTPREMAAKLELAAKWGQGMMDASRTTSEWVQKSGMYAAGAALLGPAGLLFAHYVPTFLSEDRRGLERAVDDARHAARYLAKSTDAATSYGRGDPVYDEFVRRATKVYVEAAGLYGIRETQASAVAEAVDEGGKQVERGGSGVLWLLAMAGVSYLGVKWLESRDSRTGAGGNDEGGEEGGEEGHVVVLGPRDEVVVDGDGEDGGEYDGEDERDEEDEHAPFPT
jgi:hypothetical protein